MAKPITPVLHLFYITSSVYNVMKRGSFQSYWWKKLKSSALLGRLDTFQLSCNTKRTEYFVPTKIMNLKHIYWKSFKYCHVRTIWIRKYFQFLRLNENIYIYFLYCILIYSVWFTEYIIYKKICNANRNRNKFFVWWVTKSMSTFLSIHQLFSPWGIKVYLLMTAVEAYLCCSPLFPTVYVLSSDISHVGSVIRIHVSLKFETHRYNQFCEIRVFVFFNGS